MRSNKDANGSSDTKFIQFKQFDTLSPGLSQYIVNDLIGTPLEDVDNFYKDKNVSPVKVSSVSTYPRCSHHPNFVSFALFIFNKLPNKLFNAIVFGISFAHEFFSLHQFLMMLFLCCCVQIHK